LADAELAIRDPKHELDRSISSELLYRLYNWVQFRSVLPEGKQDLLHLVEELKEFAKERDWNAVIKTLEELDDVVQGARQPPDLAP
jgi:hypothetical protein